MNHGGDEYAAAPTIADGSPEPKWPPARAAENIAWSELGDDGVVEFAATRDMAAGEEALMSYGDRSNDHFLIYYGTAAHSVTSRRNVRRFRLRNHPTYPTKGDYVVPKSRRV